MADLRAWINEGPGRWVAIGVCALVIVGAVVAAVRFSPWSGDRRAAEIRRRGTEVLYVCQGCGQSGKTRVAFDEEFPIVCPHCGEKKAVLGTVCVQCRHVFPAPNSSYYRCPHCGRVYDNRALSPGQGRP